MRANDDTAEIGVKIAGVGGKAVIYTNGTAGGNRLVVTLTNLTAAPIPLTGGRVASPARPGAASMLYLGFGTLLTGAQLNGLSVTADGWDGEAFTGAINNWGIAPKQDMILAAGGSIEITIRNIMSTVAPQSGWLTVSHRNFGELEDDAVQAELKLENPPAPPGRLDLVVSLEPQEIQVTAPGRREIENSLRLRFTNPHPRDLVAEGTPRVGTPTFTITFDYPDPQHPDRGAIATRAEAFNFKLNAGTAYENTWTRVSPTQQADLEWKLLPQDRAILGPHGIVEFTFEKMVSTLPPVATVMYIRYFNIPGYANGSFTLEIRKKAPVPRIELFGAVPTRLDWGAEVVLTWRTFGSDFRYIKGIDRALEEHASTKLTVARSLPEYTLVCGKGEQGSPVGKTEESTVRLTVNPPVVEFDVNPKVIDLNGTVTVTWKVISAGTCEIERSWEGSEEVISRAFSSTHTLTLRRTTTFTLKAVGNGEVTRSITVTVNPPVVEWFNTHPTLIDSNGTLVLGWNVKNAERCVVTAPGKSFEGFYGYHPMTLAATTTFTLKATGAVEVTREFTPKVLALQIVSFTAKSTSLGFRYAKTEVVWNVTNAKRVKVVGHNGLYPPPRLLGDETAQAGQTVISGRFETLGEPWLYEAEITCWGDDGEISRKMRTGYDPYRPQLAADMPVEGAALPEDSRLPADLSTTSLSAVSFPQATPAAADNPGIGLTALNGAGKAVLYIGNDTLTVTLTNTSGAPLLLPGGAPVAEPSIGTVTTPAALYLTFGTALDHDAFKALKIAAPGWSAVYFESPARNWGLFPDHATTLAAGASVSFSIANVVVAGQPRPGFLTIDYYNIGGLPGDSPQIPLPVQRRPQGPTDLNIDATFPASSTIDVTPSGSTPLANTLTLAVRNRSATDPLVAPDAPPGTSSPIFFLYFVYGKQPGYWSLCTQAEASAIQVATNPVPIDGWTPRRHGEDDQPYWTLTPQTQEILGVGQAGVVDFQIGNIVTGFSPGTTLLYLQWANIPGHNDGCTTVPIVKQLPAPRIISFGTTATNVDWGGALELTWTTRAADFCFITYDDSKGSHPVPVPLSGSRSFTVEQMSPTYTLVCGRGTPTQPVGAQDRSTIPISVNPPVIERFDASRATVQQHGSVTITWHVKSAGECQVLVGGQVVASGLSGTHTATLDNDTTFTLVAAGNGSESRNLTVGIGAVRVLYYSYYLNVLQISGGVEYATYIEEWVESLDTHESRLLSRVEGSADSPITRCGYYTNSFKATERHYITCYGRGGPVKQYPRIDWGNHPEIGGATPRLGMNVADDGHAVFAPWEEPSMAFQAAADPPSVTEFRASATQVARGASVTVSWEVESIVSCELQIDGSTVGTGVSGSCTMVMENTTTFTLVCDGTTRISSELTVTVMPVEILAFSATKNADGTWQITWNAAFASAVTIAHVAGGSSGPETTLYSKETPGPSDSGSIGFTPGDLSGDDEFVIICAGEGGPATRSHHGH